MLDILQPGIPGVHAGEEVKCHLLADTVEELHAMAARLGVQRRWLQCRPGKTPHYDLCKRKRAAAVRLGAIEVTRRDAAAISKRLKAGRSSALLPVVRDREQKAEQVTFHNNPLLG